MSRVLDSQHPATYVWADIRKLRPVEDDRAEDSDTTWEFKTSPDYPVDADKITGSATTMPSFMAICASGFDSTPYVCEILKQTIEWNIKSEYRVSPAEGNTARSLGLTDIERYEESGGPGEHPFGITINIAANLMWPLLVDEYSPAEKASATLNIAGTMLHELAVSDDPSCLPKYHH